MHKKLIKQATDEQLREYITDVLSMIKETDHDLYETLEMHLYKELYGCHFCDWKLEQALSKMINEDGTTGGNWNIEQTNGVAKELGYTFKNYNQYDFNYVMNMMYSDYYKTLQNDTSMYGRLSIDFLEDKDSPEGKALKYYIAMKN